MAVIETQRLTKRYGHSRGVTELDLRVERGEAFGFLGPNGAGKTTTIRLLLDLIRASSGTARVLGIDTRRQSVTLRRRVGYLPGELALYGRLTGMENLQFFAALRAEVDWTWVGELAARLDCDLSRVVGDLSTGNKRKVALVQALMHRPELLILDEPTAGLDPLVQREFHELVREATGAGQTVFLSSHNLPEVQRVCHRVGFVREGRLIAVDHVAALSRKLLRDVEIVFLETAPATAFAHLAGVSKIEAHGASLRFRLTGSFDPVVKLAADYPVESLSSREPDLEDLFLAYYDEDRSANIIAGSTADAAPTVDAAGIDSERPS